MFDNSSMAFKLMVEDANWRAFHCVHIISRVAKNDANYLILLNHGLLTKNGDLYGYAKQCGAAIDRHPISITTDQLKTIKCNQSI